MKIKQGFKGFDRNFQCRGFQFAPGQTFEHDRPAELCKAGFHFCEHPLDVLGYYPPANSRFAEVEGEGCSDERSGDTKIAASKLHIKAEVSLGALIQAAVKFVFDRATWTKEKSVEGDNEAASATGDRGAASATGDRGAASATGYRGAASATGDRGAASATGDSGAASATGYRGAASATGRNGIASALGIEGRAQGAVGVWLVLSEWERDDREEYGWRRVNVKTALVDGDAIKADTWYWLKGGEIVEVPEGK